MESFWVCPECQGYGYGCCPQIYLSLWLSHCGLASEIGEESDTSYFRELQLLYETSSNQGNYEVLQPGLQYASLWLLIEKCFEHPLGELWVDNFD